MFSIEMQGLEALIRKFDGLTKQIEDAKADLPREFVDWQRDDMHRRYPSMQTGQLGGGAETFAVTSIFPRSRTYKAPTQRGGKRKGPRRYGQVRSVRPILRRELYDKMLQRMVELGRKALKWP